MKQEVDIALKTSADTSGADTVKNVFGSLTNEAEKANQAIKGSAIEMGAAMSVAQGNVNGIIKLVVALGKRVGILKDLSLAGIAAIAAAATSVFKLFSASKDLIKEVFNLGGAPKELRDASSVMYDITSSAAEFADEMKTARTEAAQLTKSFNEQVDAINKLTKAQNELHRQQMLAKASSDEEKAKINNVYNSLNTQGDDKAASDKLARREKDLNDEEARLRAEIARAEKDRDAFINEAANLSEKAKSTKTNWASAMVKGWFGANPNDRAAAMFTNAATARGLANDKDAEIEAAKKKLAELADVRKKLEIERQAIETTTAAHTQAAKNVDLEAYKKAVAERDALEEESRVEMVKRRQEEVKKREEDYKKALEDRASVEEAAIRKANDHRVREEMKALKKLHDERMKNLEKEARKWEESAARAADPNNAGFAAWRAAEQNANRAADREKNQKDKDIKQAEKRLAEVRAEMARGKAFDTDYNRNLANQLEDYIKKRGGDKNTYEDKMLQETKNIEDKLSSLSEQLGRLGL